MSRRFPDLTTPRGREELREAQRRLEERCAPVDCSQCEWEINVGKGIRCALPALFISSADGKKLCFDHALHLRTKYGTEMTRITENTELSGEVRSSE